ncbi:MAG: hypothetical protein ABI481_12485 [Pyrinomonadaceae bacterium]
MWFIEAAGKNNLSTSDKKEGSGGLYETTALSRRGKASASRVREADANAIFFSHKLLRDWENEQNFVGSRGRELDDDINFGKANQIRDPHGRQPERERHQRNSHTRIDSSHEIIRGEDLIQVPLT